jgi:cytochrome P450
MSVAISLRELLGEKLRHDPYPFYARLHEQGQAVRLSPQDRYDAAVYGYQAADQVLRDPAFCVLEDDVADRGGARWRDHPVLRTLQTSMFNASGNDLVRLRRLFGQMFSARRMAAMGPSIERATDRALDRLAGAGAHGTAVDFVAELAVPLPADVIGDVVGVPQDARAWLPPRVLAFDAVLELYGRSFRALRAADGAAEELIAYYSGLLAARRADPREDLVSTLAQVQAENPDELADFELIANLIVVFNAGFRTTASLLGSGLTLLAEHPDARAALRADPSLSAAYVEEMLRFEPPVQFKVIYAAEDTEIEGVPVAKGESVVVLTGAANRDPRQFPDPDTFDPSRAENRHLAFSAGPHYCLGATLGRAEAEHAFPRILERFPSLALAGKPHGRRDLFMRGYKRLPVRLTGGAAAGAAAAGI